MDLGFSCLARPSHLQGVASSNGCSIPGNRNSGRSCRIDRGLFDGKNPALTLNAKNWGQVT